MTRDLRGGTPDAPIVYSGNGSTRVPGIRSEGVDNIVIQGFVSDGADSTVRRSIERASPSPHTVRRTSASLSESTSTTSASGPSPGAMEQT